MKVTSSYSVFLKSNKNSFIPNRTEISKVFEPIVNYQKFNRHYDYLNITTNLQKNISPQDMKIRSDLEYNRFFTRGASLTPTDFNAIEDNVAKAITDTSEASRLFVSPLMFNYGAESYDLKDVSNIDTESISEGFLRSEEESQMQIRSFETIRTEAVASSNTNANPTVKKKNTKKSKRIKNTLTQRT